MLKLNDLNIEVCDVNEIKNFIETHHYSKSINGVKVSICFSVKTNGLLVGAVLFGQFATTAWKKFVNNETDVLELRRLVLLDECPRNSESMVIGKTLRYIKKNIKNIKTIVSYADPFHGHNGVIYRASNFKYLGLSASDKGYFNPINGKTYHSRALRTKYKNEYKPFVKELRLLKEMGILKEVVLPGKHCYRYDLR